MTLCKWEVAHRLGWPTGLAGPGDSMLLLLGKTDTHLILLLSRLHIYLQLPLIKFNQFTQTSEKFKLVVSASEVAGLALCPILLPVTL